MATRKQDSKTIEQYKKEYYDGMVAEMRKVIEREISNCGQFGFSTLLGISHAQPEISRKALAQVIEEYRAAGWQIDYDAAKIDEVIRMGSSYATVQFS
jgi:hypothetical protein